MGDIVKVIDIDRIEVKVKSIILRLVVVMN